MGNKLFDNGQYKSWLKDLKQQVRQTQLKAAVSVNTALLEFYWQLGADIVEKQQDAVWGSGFLKQLSHDLLVEFPDIKGFSLANLQYVRRWYSFYGTDLDNSGTACSTIAKVPFAQLLQIPWGHNLVIISKCSSVSEALFYVQKTSENNWSRNVLVHQIESCLSDREGKAISNFSTTLPTPQSDLAKQILKDPYNFDFLSLTDEYNERQLEKSLVTHITEFLLELGAGFAYVGKQVPLQVSDRDFFLDLLFYHTKLHCFVVVELKTVDFEPEHAGKLNFYLTAVDQQMKSPEDKASIGILLCKSKDSLIAEYALRDINKPIGVSEYELTQALPDDLKASLPSIAEIEAELGGC